MTGRARLALIASVLVAAGFGYALAAVTQSSGDVETATVTTPQRTAFAPPRSQAGSIEEVFSYDDLAQMQATSDLVVSGTVTAINPGRTVGGSGGNDGPAAAEEYGQLTGAIQFNEVVVHVDEWLGGTSEIEPGSEIVLEEEMPVAVLAPSSAVGDSGVYFVMEKGDRPGAYVLSGSPARFLRTADSEALLSSNPEIDWAAEAAKQPLEELQAQIRRIQGRVDSGEIEPARSPFDRHRARG
ncbi:MAG: hypothetical protein QOI10_1069 [Solirubrobacterales bacterium]|jgi:hypothetical protein|nr:hypothetical protein [Solirubrobacterales bacterium]